MWRWYSSQTDTAAGDGLDHLCNRNLPMAQEANFEITPILSHTSQGPKQIPNASIHWLTSHLVVVTARLETSFKSIWPVSYMTYPRWRWNVQTVHSYTIFHILILKKKRVWNWGNPHCESLPHSVRTSQLNEPSDLSALGNWMFSKVCSRHLLLHLGSRIAHPQHPPPHPTLYENYITTKNQWLHQTQQRRVWFLPWSQTVSSKNQLVSITYSWASRPSANLTHREEAVRQASLLQELLFSVLPNLNGGERALQSFPSHFCNVRVSLDCCLSTICQLEENPAPPSCWDFQKSHFRTITSLVVHLEISINPARSLNKLSLEPITFLLPSQMQTATQSIVHSSLLMDHHLSCSMIRRPHWACRSSSFRLDLKPDTPTWCSQS